MNRRLSITSMTILVFFALGAAACDDDSSSDAAPTTATVAPVPAVELEPAQGAPSAGTSAEFCNDAELLAVLALNGIDGQLDDVVSQVDDLNSQVDNVQTLLDKLIAESGNDQTKDDLEALKGEVQAFQDTLDELDVDLEGALPDIQLDRVHALIDDVRAEYEATGGVDLEQREQDLRERELAFYEAAIDRIATEGLVGENPYQSAIALEILSEAAEEGYDVSGLLGAPDTTTTTVP